MLSNGQRNLTGIVRRFCGQQASCDPVHVRLQLARTFSVGPGISDNAVDINPALAGTWQAFDAPRY